MHVEINPSSSVHKVFQTRHSLMDFCPASNHCLNYDDYFGAYLESNLIWPVGRWRKRNEGSQMRNERWGLLSSFEKTIQEHSFQKEKENTRTYPNRYFMCFTDSQTLMYAHSSACTVSKFLSLLWQKTRFFCLCASFTFSPSVAINLWGTEKVVAHARGLHSRSPFPKCFRTHLKGSTSKIFHCELGPSRTKLFRFFRWNSSLQKFKLN